MSVFHKLFDSVKTIFKIVGIRALLERITFFHFIFEVLSLLICVWAIWFCDVARFRISGKFERGKEECLKAGC